MLAIWAVALPPKDRNHSNIADLHVHGFQAATLCFPITPAMQHQSPFPQNVLAVWSTQQHPLFTASVRQARPMNNL